jgi:magnesium chelatase accessory protein
MITRRQVHAGGLNWAVAEAGQGPVVLLVHGTAASLHSWRDVVPLLAATHKVIAMDLPGHGGTGHLRI